MPEAVFQFATAYTQRALEPEYSELASLAYYAHEAGEYFTVLRAGTLYEGLRGLGETTAVDRQRATMLFRIATCCLDGPYDSLVRGAEQFGVIGNMLTDTERAFKLVKSLEPVAA